MGERGGKESGRGICNQELSICEGGESESSPRLRAVRDLVALGCGTWWDGMGRRLKRGVKRWPDCVELCVPN